MLHSYRRHYKRKSSDKFWDSFGSFPQRERTTRPSIRVLINQHHSSRTKQKLVAIKQNELQVLCRTVLPYLVMATPCKPDRSPNPLSSICSTMNSCSIPPRSASFTCGTVPSKDGRFIPSPIHELPAPYRLHGSRVTPICKWGSWESQHGGVGRRRECRLQNGLQHMVNQY